MYGPLGDQHAAWLRVLDETQSLSELVDALEQTGNNYMQLANVKAHGALVLLERYMVALLRKYVSLGHMRRHWQARSSRESLHFSQSPIASVFRRLWFVYEHSPLFWITHNNSDGNNNNRWSSVAWLDEASRRLDVVKRLIARVESRLADLFALAKLWGALCSRQLDIEALCQDTWCQLSDNDLDDDVDDILLVTRRCDALLRDIDRCVESELVGVPSFAERHWLPISVAVVGSAFAARALNVRRPLIGEWLSTAAAAASTFWRERVLAQLSELAAIVMRPQALPVLSVDGLRSTEASLVRMCVDFVRDTAAQPLDAERLAVVAQQAHLGDIAPVMQQYEQVLGGSLLSYVSARFVRSLAIQVQCEKLSIERALFALDSLLRSNELLFACLASLPIVTVAIVVPQWLYRFAARRFSQAELRVQLRRDLAAVDRMLQRELLPSNQGNSGDASSSPSSSAADLILVVERLYARSALLADNGIVRQFHADLDDLGAIIAHDPQHPLRLHIIPRFFRAYSTWLLA
jgi:ATP synthase regulation protein NCA2